MRSSASVNGNRHRGFEPDRGRVLACMKCADGFAGGVFDEFAAELKWEAGGGITTCGGLHLGGSNAGSPLAGFSTDGLITADHDDRDTQFTTDRSIETELTGNSPVQP